MQEIYLNDPVVLIIPIPESSSGNTVTYEIFNTSGTVLASGSMTFIRDEMWKVSFTPAALGTIVLKVNNTTTGQKRENTYRVVASSSVVTVDSGSVPTTQEMLDNVRKAINAKLVGGAVQSYSISGRNIQHYSLSELRDLERSLRKDLASERGTGARNYAKFGTS